MLYTSRSRKRSNQRAGGHNLLGGARPECLLHGSPLKLAVKQPGVAPFATLMESASGHINEYATLGAQPAPWFPLAPSLTPLGAGAASITGNTALAARPDPSQMATTAIFAIYTPFC